MKMIAGDNASVELTNPSCASAKKQANMYEADEIYSGFKSSHPRYLLCAGKRA